MKFTELKPDLQNGSKGIYLLEGNDAYFIARAEEQIKEAFLEMPELNYASFDGSSMKGSAYTEFTAALNAFPFMAEKRVIKVFDLYPTETDYDKYLKSTFENFPETTVLMIVNTQSKKGVDLKRKKAVCYVDCNHADPETVTKWAYITMKRAGVSSTVEACEAISAYCLCDMARVSKEVEKFIMLKKDGTVTKRDVDDLVYKDADYRIYEMTNAISAKNYSKFCEICLDLMDKGYDENAIIASLLAYFKNLLSILSSSMSDGELATLLKMKEYGVKKSREQAQTIGSGRLVSYVTSLYSLSADIKCGNLTPEGAFSSALCKVLFS